MHNRQASTLQGIVLGTSQYGEADKIVTIFSKERGKMVALAKGIKKLSSRKRASLEVFSNISFQHIEGKGMGIITEVRLDDHYANIRLDLKKIAVAYFFCEVVKKITPDREPHPEIYELLKSSLMELENVRHAKRLKDAFIWEILENAGFAPIQEHESDPQKFLEEVLERNLGSVRIGRMLQ